MSPKLNTLKDARSAGLELVAVCHNIACRHKWLIDLDHIIHYVGGAHGLLPTKGVTHFSERMRCPACRQRGVYVWMNEPQEPVPLFGGALTYAVNEWGGNYAPLTAIARVSHLVVAHATYEAALGAYPGKHLTLQQGAFTLRDSRMKVIRGGKA